MFVFISTLDFSLSVCLFFLLFFVWYQSAKKLMVLLVNYTPDEVVYISESYMQFTNLQAPSAHLSTIVSSRVSPKLAANRAMYLMQIACQTHAQSERRGEKCIDKERDKRKGAWMNVKVTGDKMENQIFEVVAW